MASAPTSNNVVPGVEFTATGVSEGVVIAIAVVVVLLVAGAVGLIVFCCLRRRRLRRNIQPYRPGFPNANPSGTPLIEMQHSGAATMPPSPPTVKISRPESSPRPPLTQKQHSTAQYDTSQMQQEVFEAPGNDEHPPDIAFAQQAIHGSLFPGKEDKLEPETQTFLPVSPVSTPASPTLSYISPVSPLLTASSPRPAIPAFSPGPPRMNQISPVNAGLSQPPPRPEYYEPPAGIFEAPDTSVPRPIAELG